MNLEVILVSITSLLGSWALEPGDLPAPLGPRRAESDILAVRALGRARSSPPAQLARALLRPLKLPKLKAPVEASVGKGGRDLTARLRVEGRGWGQPAGTVELYGDVGEKAHLIGYSAQYYRFQPALVAGIKPDPAVELFTGIGVGPTEVVHGVCSDSYFTPCEDLQADGMLVASTTAQIGTRVEWSGPPVYAVMRLDAIAQHGWCAGLALAFETNE